MWDYSPHSQSSGQQIRLQLTNLMPITRYTKPYMSHNTADKLSTASDRALVVAALHEVFLRSIEPPSRSPTFDEKSSDRSIFGEKFSVL